VNGGTGAVSITTAGGALALGANNLSGASVALQGVGVTSTGGAVNAGAGDILVNGGAGAINLAGALTTTSNTATAVTVRHATTVALGNVTTGGTGTTTLGVGSDITGAVTQTGVITTGTLTGSTTSSVTLAGNNVLTNLGAFASNGLNVNDSAGGLNVTGAVNGGTGATSITTAGGGLAVNNSVTGTGVTLAATGAGNNIAINAAVNGSAGNMALNAGGDLAINGAIVSASGNVNVTATNLNVIGTTAPAKLGGAAVNATVSNDVTVTAGTANNASAEILGTGNVAMTVGRNITLTGAQGAGVTGAHALIQGSPDVTLTLNGALSQITMTGNNSEPTDYARIQAVSPVTVHIDFANRQDTGGIVVSGLGSGFYANGVPAVAGAGLDLTYPAAPVEAPLKQDNTDPVATAVLNTVDNAITTILVEFVAPAKTVEKKKEQVQQASAAPADKGRPAALPTCK
jgi:hypothetical protein